MSNILLVNLISIGQLDNTGYVESNLNKNLILGMRISRDRSIGTLNQSQEHYSYPHSR